MVNGAIELYERACPTSEQWVAIVSGNLPQRIVDLSTDHDDAIAEERGGESETFMVCLDGWPVVKYSNDDDGRLQQVSTTGRPSWAWRFEGAIVASRVANMIGKSLAGRLPNAPCVEIRTYRYCVEDILIRNLDEFPHSRH